MKPLSECRLYTFIDLSYVKGKDLKLIANQLVKGGSDIIQLRAKDEPKEEVLKIALEILPVIRAGGVYLVINDYPEIASKVGADFCHLGQEDFFDRGFRFANQVTGCPKEFGLGISTHSVEQAQRALKAEPDYIAIGPVFKTGTKPTAKPVGYELVKWASENVKIPWFAIGGINFDNIETVMEAGARRICIVSAILNSDDIIGTCRKFRQIIERYPLI
jgi:thiamine-phosphate pyrophosphorylase